MEITEKVCTYSAVFPDKVSADKAYSAAIKYGYTKDEINVLMSEDIKKTLFRKCSYR